MKGYFLPNMDKLNTPIPVFCILSYNLNIIFNFIPRQECIPVGCVPPSISPLGVGLDLTPLNFPLGCGPGGPPGSRHPPGSSHPWSSHPPGAGTPRNQAPPRDQAPPPVNRMTDACENITLPNFVAGGK